MSTSLKCLSVAKVIITNIPVNRMVILLEKEAQSFDQGMEGIDLWDFYLTKAAIQDVVMGEYILTPPLPEWVHQRSTHCMDDKMWTST